SCLCLWLAACSQDDGLTDTPSTSGPSASDTLPKDPEPGNPVTIRLSLGVTPMANEEGSTRAFTPSGPEVTDMIQTAAIFEFDVEGNHDRVLQPASYFFRDFRTDATPNGIQYLEDYTGIQVVDGPSRTLCVLVNVPKDTIDAFYTRMANEYHVSDGRLLLSWFKKWFIHFDYDDDEDQNIQGQLKSMPMMGYYIGDVYANGGTYTDIPIDLGRLASRIDVQIVNKMSKDVTKDNILYYHFGNMLRGAQAYLEEYDTYDLPELLPVGKLKVAIDDLPMGSTDMRYFYAGPQFAENAEQSINLHFSTGQEPPDYYTEGSEAHSSFGTRVPLSATMPGSDMMSYYFYQNTIYHFTFNLVDGSSKTRSIRVKDVRTRGVGSQEIDLEISNNDLQKK
ncbi:MAG: hypothetical protein LUC45_04495, partial [Paraprevotella sp.]|nr:hypothetical protein [Paraprevotella sp.]